MAQPLPRVVTHPDGQNEYLAYLTRPEMQHLRANPAAPHDERLPDTGPLNTFRGVPLFYAPGEAEGTGFGGDEGGYSGYGGGGHDGADTPGFGSLSPGEIAENAGVDAWGGFGGADPARSEGGGEPSAVVPANTSGGGPKQGDDNGGGDNGGGDTGPTEAELRAQRIADAMNAINALFGGTAAQKQRLIDASYDLSASGIADAYAKAKRQLDFQMLRQGLTTGQVDIDLAADLSKVRSDSLADAMRHAQAVAEKWATNRSAKKAGLINAALSGNLMPGQVGGLAGTLSAGVPTAWSGIADIGWNIPTGFAPSGMGMFRPTWGSHDTGAYFGSTS